MSKRKKVFLCIGASILLLVVAAVLLNLDTILMFKDGIFETQESINQKKEAEEIRQEEALKEAGVSNVRPLTEEETNELNNGNLSEEDAVKIITGQATLEEIKKGQNSEENKPSREDPKNEEQEKDDSFYEKQPGETKPSFDDEKATELNNKIAELIGKIYIIEARFTSEINALEDWAVSEYNKTPKPEKAAKKKELAATGFPKLTALEKSCDAEVNAVLSELSEVLKSAGQSTEIVNQIKSAYTNKKKLTKSYYISEYM